MKEDQRIVLSKRLLKEGLLRLLKNKSLEKISVMELCDESGINRATFYRHYSRPADILKDIRMNIISDIRKIGKHKSYKNLQQWLEEICCYFQKNSDILQILINTRTDDEFIECIHELYSNSSYIRHKTADIQDDDNYRLMAYCYAGGFYYILRQWIMEPVDRTPRQIASILHMFLTGKQSLN